MKFYLRGIRATVIGWHIDMVYRVRRHVMAMKFRGGWHPKRDGHL